MERQDIKQLPMVTAENVDLSNCDREQIQFVGAIQPHGALIVVQEPELRIVQISANCGEILGQPPESLLGHDLSTLFAATDLHTLRERLKQEKLDGAPVHLLHLTLPTRPTSLHVFAHRLDGVLL